MIDFLRANTFVTKDDYMWRWSVPQIRLASRDFTHIKYLSDKEIEVRKAKKREKEFDDPTAFMNDLGFPCL